jgi:hypothetical protein
MDVVSLPELTGDAREYLRMTTRFISNHYTRFMFIIIIVSTDAYTEDGCKTTCVYYAQKREMKSFDFSSLLSANVQVSGIIELMRNDVAQGCTFHCQQNFSKLLTLSRIICEGN